MRNFVTANVLTVRVVTNIACKLPSFTQTVASTKPLFVKLDDYFNLIFTLTIKKYSCKTVAVSTYCVITKK